VTASVLNLVQSVSEDRKADLLARFDALRGLIEAGTVREAAFCYVHTDGAVSTMVGPSDDYFKMLGAMERMKIRFHNRHLDSGE
jgi:hypothetical protein